MFKLVVFCALASLTAAQQLKDSREAAILTDARYLQGNGQHGSSYSQEDGTDFKEETNPNGDRVGTYSYIDPSGQKRTISYTAGKDGFRATGDGVPVAPPPVAPLPQYNPPAQNWNQQSSQNWNQQPAQNWNQQPAQNWNQQQYNPPAVTERNWDESPNNKWDQWDDPGTWNNEASPSTPVQAAPQQQWTQQQWTAPAQPQPQPQWTAPAQPQQSQTQWNYQTTTTPAPHRFYPPGRLSLNRMPDGFSYTFNKS